MKKTIFVLALLLANTAHADLRQAALNKAAEYSSKVADEVHGMLSLAQQMGFVVNEIRIELGLTPKCEVFFRDIGDNGNFDSIIRSTDGPTEKALRALQSTRQINLAHYTPTGVKLTTCLASPKVEILASFDG